MMLHAQHNLFIYMTSTLKLALNIFNMWERILMSKESKVKLHQKLMLSRVLFCVVEKKEMRGW